MKSASSLLFCRDWSARLGRVLLAGVGLALAVSAPSLRADEVESNAAELIRTLPRGFIPPDINNHRTIFAPSTLARPLRVAIYEGSGSPEGGILNVGGRLQQVPGTTVQRLSAEQVGSMDLSGFDLLVFSGGLSTRQAAAIGEAGKDNVRRYAPAHTPR